MESEKISLYCALGEVVVAEGLKRFFLPVAWIFLSVFILSVIWNNWIPLAKDDTDPVKGRSGMEVLVDNRTGCQYLATSTGGLTPRLDTMGGPVCGSSNQR
jgi:hypothetical protein